MSKKHIMSEKQTQKDTRNIKGVKNKLRRIQEIYE